MQLVNVQRCVRGSQALRVAQSIVPLKGVPRYLALPVNAYESPALPGSVDIFEGEPTWLLMELRNDTPKKFLDIIRSGT
jgi:hypothetical protein